MELSHTKSEKINGTLQMQMMQLRRWHEKAEVSWASGFMDWMS
jgi:hypothetical protein